MIQMVTIHSQTGDSLFGDVTTGIPKGLYILIQILV
jgi:hypothetical protein